MKYDSVAGLPTHGINLTPIRAINDTITFDKKGFENLCTRLSEQNRNPQPKPTQTFVPTPGTIQNQLAEIDRKEAIKKAKQENKTDVKDNIDNKGCPPHNFDVKNITDPARAHYKSWGGAFYGHNCCEQCKTADVGNTATGIFNAVAQVGCSYWTL